MTGYVLGIEAADLRSMVDEIWSSLFSPPPEEAEDAPIQGDIVAGYVDIAGGWDGRVLVFTTAEGALAIAATLLALPESRVVPDDLADAMGELANIVGGSVKSCVEGQSTLSLPAVTRAQPEPPLAPHSLQVTALWREFPIRVRVQAAGIPSQIGQGNWGRSR